MHESALHWKYIRELVFQIEKKEDTNCSSAEVDNSHKDEVQELLQTLEQQTNWDGRRLAKYDGLWCPVRFFRPILSTQKYFKAKDSDIILATIPKSGTTWLKALTFSIVNRSVYTIDQSPLLTNLPHTLVPFLEFNVYWDQENPDLQHLSSPRIFSTHMPFKILPDSIREYELPLEIDEAFDMFCQGIHPFGPFWDNMLGYWDAHLKNPQKVLFLKYEDLKEDITFHVKKIAEFLGYPFSLEEEKQRLIEEISRLCSFENLKNLEVNKTGCIEGVVKHSAFFRKGQVGDWINYLTPAMAERIEKVMESKFQGSGLMFKTYN
ncbi:hypothetical protein Pfo_026851 [Paulownia fortunei]|nr:hypothetical protein Pfo_026851 [Paulownia fortunei]